MTPFEVEASAARDVAAVEDVAAGVDVAGVEDVAVGVVVAVGADVPTTLENALGSRRSPEYPFIILNETFCLSKDPDYHRHQGDHRCQHGRRQHHQQRPHQLQAFLYKIF